MFNVQVSNKVFNGCVFEYHKRFKCFIAEMITKVKTNELAQWLHNSVVVPSLSLRDSHVHADQSCTDLSETFEISDSSHLHWTRFVRELTE